VKPYLDVDIFAQINCNRKNPVLNLIGNLKPIIFDYFINRVSQKYLYN